MSTPVPVGQAATLRALATAMLRAAAPVAIGTVVVTVVVFALRAGAPGAWGAGLGGGIAALSSLFTLTVMRRTAALEPHAVMVASLGSFLMKMIVLLIALFTLGRVPGIDSQALALSMLAVFILVSIAETWAGYRMRSYIIDPLTSGSVTGMSESPPDGPAVPPGSTTGRSPRDTPGA